MEDNKGAAEVVDRKLKLEYELGILKAKMRRRGITMPFSISIRICEIEKELEELCRS